MDPITTAVVAALPALASDAIRSAYDGLKAVIRRKWGDGAPVATAIAAVEADPSSKAQAAVLHEKVTATSADQDADVLQALQTLVEEMKRRGVGGKTVSDIQFNMSGGSVQGVAASSNVNVGSMTFGPQSKS